MTLLLMAVKGKNGATIQALAVMDGGQEYLSMLFPDCVTVAV